MKKILSVLGIFMLLGVMGFVVAADQDVIIDGDTVIDFSINDLNFGTVTPGDTATDTSTITLNEPNNVDFLIDICLGQTSDYPFDLMKFDFTVLGGTTDTQITLCTGTPFSGTVDDTDATDTSTIQNKDLAVSLDFPVGILPGSRSGVVSYTATGPSP